MEKIAYTTNYLEWKTQKIKDEYPEFYLCEKCGGMGAYLVTHDQRTYYKFCYICQGEGKISWVEKAFERCFYGDNGG